MMPSFDILVWNCRGAGNDRFRSHFKDLITSYKPDVVALLETKVKFSSMGMFFKNIGYKASTYVDPIGRAGGIWLLWDSDRVSLNITHVTSQAIHASVKIDDYEDWIFSTIYGNPNPRIRDAVWEDLESIADNMRKGWMVAGDLNDTVSQDESNSNTADNHGSQRRRFGERINRCKLGDLGYSGSKFTWSNGREGLANIKKRLDRALSNSEWRTQFPEEYVGPARAH